MKQGGGRGVWLCAGGEEREALWGRGEVGSGGEGREEDCGGEGSLVGERGVVERGVLPREWWREETHMKHRRSAAPVSQCKQKKYRTPSKKRAKPKTKSRRGTPA